MWSEIQGSIFLLWHLSIGHISESETDPSARRFWICRGKAIFTARALFTSNGPDLT